MAGDGVRVNLVQVGTKERDANVVIRDEVVDDPVLAASDYVDTIEAVFRYHIALEHIIGGEGANHPKADFVLSGCHVDHIGEGDVFEGQPDSESSDGAWALIRMAV